MCAVWGGIIDDKQCPIKIINVMMISRPKWIKKSFGNNARFKKVDLQLLMRHYYHKKGSAVPPGGYVRPADIVTTSHSFGR